MKKDDYVLVEKLEATPDALFKPAEFDDWIPGGLNIGKGVPVGWTVEGTIVNDIVPGKMATVLRTKRNGIAALGIWETSVVKQVIGDMILTQNSIYRVTKLDRSLN